MKKVLVSLVCVLFLMGAATVSVSAAVGGEAVIDELAFSRGEITIDTAQSEEFYLDVFGTMLAESYYSTLGITAEEAEDLGVGLDQPLSQEVVDILTTASPEFEDILTAGMTLKDLIVMLSIEELVVGGVAQEDADKITGYNQLVAYTMSSSIGVSTAGDSYEFGDTVKQQLDRYMENAGIAATGFDGEFFDYFMELNGASPDFAVSDFVSDYTWNASVYDSVSDILAEEEPLETVENIQTGSVIPLQEGLNIVTISTTFQGGDGQSSYTLFINVTPLAEEETTTTTESTEDTEPTEGTEPTNGTEPTERQDEDDITTEAQTDDIKTSPPTGDTQSVGLLVVLALAAGACVALIALRRKSSSAR